MYILINSSGKRLSINGQYTPVFDYPVQAETYINRILGGSPSIKIHKI